MKSLRPLGRLVQQDLIIKTARQYLLIEYSDLGNVWRYFSTRQLAIDYVLKECE